MQRATLSPGGSFFTFKESPALPLKVSLVASCEVAGEAVDHILEASEAATQGLFEAQKRLLGSRWPE
jgi:hypothetical protein